MEKKCTKCHLIKSLDEFHKSSMHKYGVGPYCKQCRIVYNSNRKEQYQEYNKAYHQKNKVKQNKRNKCNIVRRIKALGKEKFKEIMKQYSERYRAKDLMSKRQHASTIKYRYNLTGLQYDSMVEKQKGLCAVCGNPETQRSNHKAGIKNLAVDHCHITGKVRGLLCQKCNNGLGRFDDNIELLQKAIDYLKDRQI